jgi:hypothetical protein
MESITEVRFRHCLGTPDRREQLFTTDSAGQDN